MKKIAIIGAGMAGLTLAHHLKENAHIVVFEKARGTGGRLATRYAGQYEFDHGAQFLTLKDPDFISFMQALIDAQMLERWDARFVEFDGNTITRQRQWGAEYPHYVGAPRMNQIGKFLSQDVDVKLNTKITQLEKNHKKWVLTSESTEEFGPFDWVISTAPAPQTGALYPQEFKDFNLLKTINMLGCYALMLGFEEKMKLPFDAALVLNKDISWISVNSSKPGRPPSSTLVIQATNKWADAHIEHELDFVNAHLLQEASDVVGKNLATADHIDLHKWRYANMPGRKGQPFLIDECLSLAACGDWCIKGRVESAFISANQLAHHIKGTLL